VTDAELVREIAQPLSGDPNDYDKLLELIGNARFVLLGEATHGTHEFYSERATITKRLIAEKGFSILAMEADWPDSARVHRYVRGLAGATEDTNADEALSGFRRFPTWMWRNTVVVEFVERLRGFNKNIDPKRAPVGFYGMDLYSLHASIDAVLQYLDKADPEAVRRARLRYSCFDHFSRRSTTMPRRSAQSNLVRRRLSNSSSSCSKRRPNF
jgi:erythromycin esterase-like protein